MIDGLIALAQTEPTVSGRHSMTAVIKRREAQQADIARELAELEQHRAAALPKRIRSVRPTVRIATSTYAIH
jgi:hypothetical protein